MKNMELAHKTLQQLMDWGIEDICLCPGGRNAPFVFWLKNTSHFKIHSGFDERAAGFYALGLAQSRQRPTAIITTSGTAVAEVLPALIEAYYTRTPIVMVSADRPQRMRGTGAPQTIEQNGIFSHYVEACVDIEGEWPTALPWSKTIPLHLNICLDEPLLDAPASKEFVVPAQTSADGAGILRFAQDDGLARESGRALEALSAFLKDKQNPLLLISGLKSHEVSAVQSFMKNWGGWIYAESTSGLREFQHPGLIQSGDRFPSFLLKNKKIDAVVRMGGVPTARVWRDIELSQFPVLSLSSTPFAGLSHGLLVVTEMENLAAIAEFGHFSPPSDLKGKDLEASEKLNELYQKFPSSEPALMHWVSQNIKPASEVYVGNSLPIREWDLSAQKKNPFHVRANRGANGIDGQLVSALAWQDPKRDLCVIVGDLTAMYDANGLWYKQDNGRRLDIVIINNKGGKIFERLFNEPLFYNNHSLHFKSWAAMWNCEYTSRTEPSEWPKKSGVIEIFPSLEQTEKFWAAHEALYSQMGSGL